MQLEIRHDFRAINRLIKDRSIEMVNMIPGNPSPHIMRGQTLGKLS